MQTVSSQYKNALKEAVASYKITGTINPLSDNPIGFGNDDILAGSFSFTNQICGSQDFSYGGVYSAEVSFVLVDQTLINRFKGKWKDKEMLIRSYLEVSPGQWQQVTLGDFYVAEANYSVEGLQIVAYDAMAKFNKPFNNIQGLHGIPYDLITLACRMCNVYLSGEKEDYDDIFFAPNDELYLSDATKCETWRDYLYFITQATNTYASISRTNRDTLEIHKLPNAAVVGGTNPVATRNPSERFDDLIISDFTTYFTDLRTVIHMSDGDIERSYGNHKGATIDIGDNPFLQTAAPDADAEAMLSQLRYDLESIGHNITQIDEEISDLDDEIEDLQQYVDSHPEDKAAKQQLEALKALRENKIKSKKNYEENYAELSQQIANIEASIEEAGVSVIQARLEMMAAELSGIQYNPATIKMLGDPCFDLGDVIRFTDGVASDTYSDVCIMQFIWKPNENYTIVCFGESPETNGAKSSSSGGGGSGGGSGSGGDKINFVHYINGNTIDLSDHQEHEVGRVRFSLTKEAECETWFETKLQTQRDNDDIHITYRYYLDGLLVTDYYPEETWYNGGIHTKNCQYHLFKLDTTTEHEWRVTAICDEGTIEIGVGDARILLWAQGLSAQPGWDGIVSAEDSFSLYPIVGMNLKGNFTEIVNVTEA